MRYGETYDRWERTPRPYHGPPDSWRDPAVEPDTRYLVATIAGVVWADGLPTADRARSVLYAAELYDTDAEWSVYKHPAESTDRRDWEHVYSPPIYDEDGEIDVPERGSL